jgi:hypothetical protein
VLRRARVKQAMEDCARVLQLEVGGCLAHAFACAGEALCGGGRRRMKSTNPCRAQVVSRGVHKGEQRFRGCACGMIFFFEYVMQGSIGT